jgi:hypothetical protein
MTSPLKWGGVYWWMLVTISLKIILSDKTTWNLINTAKLKRYNYPDVSSDTNL